LSRPLFPVIGNAQQPMASMIAYTADAMLTANETTRGDDGCARSLEVQALAQLKPCRGLPVSKLEERSARLARHWGVAHQSREDFARGPLRIIALLQMECAQ